MNITPEDIQQHQFKVKFRGFNIQEVDAYLEQMADAFDLLLSKNKSLQEDIERRERENRDFREREETFKHALVNSQRVLEQMKDNARKSSELIVSEAEVRAEKMLNRAHNRLAQLHEDIAELKRQRIQIEAQIRSILEAHTKLLEMEKREMAAIEEEESKLTILRQST